MSPGLSVAEPKYFQPPAFASLLSPGPVAAPITAVDVGVPPPVLLGGAEEDGEDTVVVDVGTAVV